MPAGPARSAADVAGDVDLVRVTVSSGAGRLDLALPGLVPVAELVPDLARLAGLLEVGSLPGGFGLVTSQGRPLAGDAGLVAQGVADGGVLVLTAGRAEIPAPRADDPALAVAEVVCHELPRWDAACGRRAALVTASVALGGGAVALLLQPGSGRAVGSAGGLAVALLVVAGALSRAPRMQRVCVPAAWLGCGYAGVAGLLLGERLSVAGPLGLAGAAVLAAGWAAIGSLSRDRLQMVPVIVLGSVLALAGLAPRVTRVEPIPLLAATTCVLVVCGHDLSRWALGVWAQGLEASPPDHAGVDADAVRRHVRSAHELLAAVSASIGLLLVATAPLAVSLGPSGVAAAVAASAVVMLRTRGLVRREVLIGLGAGTTALVGVSASVLWSMPAWRPWLAGSAAATGLVLLLGAVPRGGGSARLGRVGDVAEGLAVVVLLPALVLACGVVRVVEGGG